MPLELDQISMNGTASVHDKQQNMSLGSLKVIIVGGGIGGLMAGIVLRQQGHRIELYEQSRFANEIGAAIHVTPNANSVLQKHQVLVEDTGAVFLTKTRLLKHSGQLLNAIDNTETAKRWQSPWMLAHRAHLHTHLKEVATSAKGPGQPVNVHTSSKVTKVNPHAATVVLQDGTQIQGDLVIGADGVHSMTRAAISDKQTQPFKSNHNAIRFMVTKEAAMDEISTQELVTEPGCMNMWYGPDRKIVLYPTANNTLFNFVCIHPAELSETTDDYNKSISKKQLLDIYHDFEPGVLKMLEKSDPETIKVYPLYDMETLPMFVDERLALIGDAAHPFTPHLAQGGAMAIEDAVSLGIMLPSGTTPDHVPERLQLYNKARYERASTVQNNSRRTGGDGVKKDASTAEFNLLEVMDHGLNHDEIHHSTQILREYQWQQNPNAYWRQPTAFGPMPGPRQDFRGIPYSPSLAPAPSSTTATIKFKTSATLLRSLFPNPSYRFAKSDTVAHASFAVQTLNNLPWLAGGSYDLFAFYIHGVQYISATGETSQGSFCPVMFENLADPVLSGREELGFPKLFSDISIVDNRSSIRARISWRGAEWAEVQWDGIEEDSKDRGSPKDDLDGEMGSNRHTHTDEIDQGLLVHKCVPASDMKDREKQRADVEYDVFFPSWFSPLDDTKKLSRRKARHAEVSIRNLGFHKLPTIHHIVERLAEIPFFEVVETTIVEAQGLADTLGARRLE